MSALLEDERTILNHFASFPNSFSVDWFPEFPVSKILHVLQWLVQEHWISPRTDRQGWYAWSSTFPREEIVGEIPAESMAGLYRRSIPILMENLPEDDESTLLIGEQCLLAGLQEEDLDIIVKAALIEERNHRIPYAIRLYDSILDLFEVIRAAETAFSERTWHIVIRAITRRTSLSLFHPSLKKANRYLLTALNTAKNLHDIRSQASLELLMGQHYWMSAKYSQATEHFENGGRIITQIEDEDLYKLALKVKGLVYVMKGQYLKAIETYEQSLGEIETADDNDFSFLAALNLALCYTQVGMPQRGLGICEGIHNHSKKNQNWPLLTFALVTTGMILLDIEQLKACRSYFNEALELARRENIPMAEVLCGIGLANVDCQEGSYEAAAEHFNLIWRIRKSSRYFAMNFYPLIPAAYILHSKGVVDAFECTPIVDYLNQVKREEVNTFMYAMFQRLQMGLPENNESIPEKIGKLIEVEKTVTQMGATLELARIRIELARLFSQNCQWQKAQTYAQQAYDFFKPFAPNCFPPDLQHLVPGTKLNKNERLFDLAIEMGEALNDHDTLDGLLTKIITSISRLTGAERAALFIKDKNTSSLKMIASRNFLEEETQEPSFADSLKAIHSSLLSNDGKIIQYNAKGQDESHLRQVIVTPLRSGRRIAGVLYQDSRFFSLKESSDDVRLLSAFASQIGVFIDRAQAYEEIARLNRKLVQENLYYLEEQEEFRPFGEIIGESQAVQHLHRLIGKVAPTPSTVLISGETGVGKELVARAIHRASLRIGHPFIRVNCAALPDTLIDSELFGHETGAFTGAIKTKAGRFELANLGTIFLDEVSELPLATQSRLLRIIQEKEFQRVGGTKILNSDFRLLTATNKDLRNEVARGRFREDLFYRLNVFPIHVPPLRDRKEDIPLLAIHFLKLFCSRSNKPYADIPEQEMEKLRNYSWPGNIRELSNMIERAVISDYSKIRFAELEVKEGREMPVVTKDMNVKTREIVKGDGKDLILEALKKTNGKVGGKDGAAALLGITRSALIHRMTKFEIKIERSPRSADRMAT